ncbi:hypothetical protein V8C34DRAFT_14542 [Trichoderma compactum]
MAAKTGELTRSELRIEVSSTMSISAFRLLFFQSFFIFAYYFVESMSKWHTDTVYHFYNMILLEMIFSPCFIFPVQVLSVNA